MSRRDSDKEGAVEGQWFRKDVPCIGVGVGGYTGIAAGLGE